MLNQINLSLMPFTGNNPRHRMVHGGLQKALQHAHDKNLINLDYKGEGDILLATSTPIVNPHDLRLIFLDCEGLYERIPIDHADLILTTEENAIQTFQDQFSCPVYHLPLGFDPEIYKAQETPYTADITFCGTLFDPRPEVLSWLDPVSSKYKIRIITPTSWQSRLLDKGNIEIISSEEWMPLGETISYYSQSKIILCISRAKENKNTHLKNKTPGRSFGEAALSCTFIDNSRDISKFFTPGEEIITFKLDQTGSDLRACLQFYLEEFEDLREEVASAGRKRALKEHTWDHRVKYLIDRLQFFL